MTNVAMNAIFEDLIMKQAAKDKMEQMESNDKQKELEEKQRQEEQDELDEMFGDEEMKKIMNKMRAEMEQEMLKNQKKQEQGIGEYREISEDEFLSYVTKNQFAVVHFYHKDFEKCKVMDKHLREIALKHPECKFLNLNAEKCPFFIQKLQIQVLPTTCCFIGGVMKERIVGFEGLGGIEDFNTLALTRRLVKLGLIKAKDDDERGFKLKQKYDSDDDADRHHDDDD